MLHILNRFIDDPDEHAVPQPYSFILDLGENPISDDGLEDGEEHQDGEIVKVLQAKCSSLDNGIGLEVPELVVAAELTIPGQGIPVLAAEAPEGLRMSSGRLIPFPGIVERDHSSRLWKAASKVD